MTDRVLICDDDARRIESWVEDVQVHLPDVGACTGQDLADLVVAVNQRSDTARASTDGSGHAGAGPDLPVRLDGVEYAFLDFDLTPDQAARASTGEADAGFIEELRGRTGERLAYLSRAHSTAGYLVVINQHFRKTTFDLTMQRFATSFADLNIAAGDLKNQGLWTGVSEGLTQYLPWSWPVLSRAAATTYACRDLVGDDLDKPVLATLGLPRRSFHSRQLDVFPDDPDTATFRDLVRSGLGLDPKDEPTEGNETVVAASALSRWLSQVLAAQNVVSDLPHVLTRFPNLGTEDLFASDALKAHPAAELPHDLRERRDQRLSELLGRDVWTLDTVRQLAAGRPPDDGSNPIAFCEDVSRFVPLDDAVEVETDLPGPYARRFVANIPNGVSYQPRNRLLG